MPNDASGQIPHLKLEANLEINVIWTKNVWFYWFELNWINASSVQLTLI